MILFHGSNVVVENPMLLPADRTLDFGNGFYTTTDDNQAVNWCRIKCNRKKAMVGYISSYQIADDFLIESRFKQTIFDTPSHEWLIFYFPALLNTFAK